MKYFENRNPRIFKFCIKISFSGDLLIYKLVHIVRLRKTDFILESKMAELNQNKKSK